MQTFDGPPSPHKVNFQQVLIHIYADLRSFCCLMVRVYKQDHICKNISLNKNIEYCSLQPDQIQISNMFLPRNLTEYDYSIYLFLTTRLNTNAEYIQNKKIEYSYFNMQYLMPIIQIFLYSYILLLHCLRYLKYL